MARVFSRVLVLLLTVLLIVGGATSLPSCTPSPQVTLGKMHIIDATHLFIAPGSGNKLFKITEAGYIQEVTYEDENGNNVTMVEEPVAVYDVNSEYVIVCFSPIDVELDQQCTGYLVRKTDGAVFSLENVGCPDKNRDRYYNMESVFTDSIGNIYYLAGGVAELEIIKLNTENMDSITKIRYSPSGDHVDFFVVDKDGNAAYYGSPKGYPGHFNRIRTAEGSIYDGLFDDSPDFWLGPDGMIYCVSFVGGELEDYCIIEKVSINSTTGVPTKSEYYAFNVSGEVQTLSWSHKLELQDRVIFVKINDPPYNMFVCELYNPTNSARCLNITAYFDLSEVYSIVASDNFYYLWGSNSSSNSVFVRVDPTDDSYTALTLSTDEYYVYTIWTYTADELIFNALRMSDGVNVVGKFDVSGNLTIMDEESDVEIVVLERIQ